MKDDTATIKEPTLDERIAGVLASDADFRPASEIAALLREVDEQIARADQLGREMRARSVDPAILDPTARGAAEDSEFRASRLRNGQARLRELHREAQLREALVQWHAQADDIERRRDEIAAEFRERYKLASGWLVLMLEKMALIDDEIDHLNMSAPGYEARRLVSTECVARGIQRLGSSEAISKNLKLPAFVDGPGTLPVLWPKNDNFSVQLVSTLFGWKDPQLNGGPRPHHCEMVNGEPRMVFEDGSMSPPNRPPQPSTVPITTLQEQIHAQQQERAEDSAKLAEFYRQQEAARRAQNAEEAARAKAFDVEQRRLRAGRLPDGDGDAR